MGAQRFIYEVASKERELKGWTEEILFYAEFNLNCILLLRFRDELALNRRCSPPLGKRQELSGSRFCFIYTVAVAYCKQQSQRTLSSVPRAAAQNYKVLIFRLQRNLRVCVLVKTTSAVSRAVACVHSAVVCYRRRGTNFTLSNYKLDVLNHCH